MPLSDEQVARIFEMELIGGRLCNDTRQAMRQARERFTPCECRRVYWAISMAPSVYPDHYRYANGSEREIPYPDDAPFCMFCGRRLVREVPHAETPAGP